MNPYQHKVQYYETDKMAIAHHSNHIRWMEEARMDFFSQIGCNYKNMEDMGIISPVTAIECKYKHTAAFSDQITISVWVEEFKGVKLKLRYKMENEQALLVCEGHSEHCFLSPTGKILNLKKAHPEIYQALASQVL